MKFTSLLFSIFLFATASLSGQSDHVQGEILAQFTVKAKPQLVVDQYKQVRGVDIQLVLAKKLSKPMNIYKLSFDPEAVSEDLLLELLRNDRDILNAQFNHYIYPRETTPNDPDLTEQWHHVNDGSSGTEDADIDSDQAWDITTGGLTALGDTIVACVIEGGNILHNDLIDNAWFNYNEIPDNGIDDDNNGYIDDFGGWNVASEDDEGLYNADHGTKVLGMIGATGNNEYGTTGINWNVKLMVVGGQSSSDEASVVEAYTYPLVQRQLYEASGGESGAFVVVTNASWGIDNGDPLDVPIWAAFYDTLGTYGILNCGATSNNDVNIDVVGDIPTAVASDYMISVTATNANDVRTFSGFGQESVDLGAPGQNVVTSAGQSGITTTTGTSFASPLTAGVIALMYSVPCASFAQLAHDDPALSADFVRHALFQGVDPIENLEFETVTGGRLNAYNSLMEIMQSCDSVFCMPPLNFDYTLTDDTIYTFTWDAAENVEYTALRFRETGTDQWMYIDSITGQSLQIDSLLHCAEYEVEIASSCAGAPQEADFDSQMVIQTEGCCVGPDDLSVSTTPDIPLLLEWTQGLDIDAYLVRYRLAGETEWISAGSSSDFYSFTDLDECQTYEFMVIPTCLPALDEGTEITATTPGCGYCLDTPFCETGGETTFYEFIDKIVIGGYENNTGSNEGYALFEDTGLELGLGEDYEVSFTPGFGAFGTYDEYFVAWIDFNQDGEFGEAEKVFESQGADSQPATGEITIPGEAPLGENRLRISMKAEDSSPLVPGPCTSFQYGETEDYCIVLVDSVSGISDEPDLVHFELYPNPGKGVFRVNFQPAAQLAGKEYAIQILDLAGKKMAQRQVAPGLNSITLDLESGVYILQLQNKKGISLHTEKLLILD